jgi:hypothetical protein
LPRPPIIPGVRKIVTLVDVRELIERHLPQNYRAKTIWCYVAAKLKQAAYGAVTADVVFVRFHQTGERTNTTLSACAISDFAGPRTRF